MSNDILAPKKVNLQSLATPALVARPVTPAPQPRTIPLIATKPMSRPVAVAYNPAPVPVAARPARSHVLRRDQFAGQTPLNTPIAQKRSKKLTRKNRTGIIMAVLAVLLFATGMGIGALQLNTNHQASNQVHALARAAQNTLHEQGDDGSVPTEAKTDVASYKVAADLPRVIIIPKLNVKARILPVGVKANNEVKTPTSIFDVGWFNASSLPGARGAMFLDGHVHGPSLPGVFANLKKLKAGDTIQIEKGDGTVVTYQVVKSQSYPKDAPEAMAAALSPVEGGVPGLNLITCDGVYDAQGNYQNRLLISASLVQ